MAFVLRPFVWFYHEFGVNAIHDTGRNAYLIVLARSCRMFAYGVNSLVLALFFAELSFSDSQIGLFMTLTLVGDVFLGILLTLVADRVGRRRILFAGSFLMVLSGAVFAIFENFWILLFAAVFGVISATGGDFGPFRAIEESVLSQLTNPQTRSDVLAWYVTMSTWGSSIGSEVSGRAVEFLRAREGWTLAHAYHSLFWVYAIMGIVNAGLVSLLTSECEAPAKEESYEQVPQDEAREGIELDDQAESHQESRQPPAAHPSRVKSWFRMMSRSMTGISASTRVTMYKLWTLLAIDSLADGMVPYTLTNYYMDTKFHPSKATLGDVTSVAYLLGAISSIFAGPLARRIGLINTMVFTHIPSSAAVLFFALPNVLWMTVILLFIRAGLNNMDQGPRSAFIAAVVKPEERTAVMGITSMLRTLAATAGPSMTGLLASKGRFWVAFVAGGSFRLIYDVGLWLLFVNMKLHQHETKDVVSDIAEQQRLRDEEAVDELASLASGDEVEFSSDESGDKRTKNSQDSF